MEAVWHLASVACNWVPEWLQFKIWSCAKPPNNVARGSSRSEEMGGGRFLLMVIMLQTERVGENKSVRLDFYKRINNGKSTIYCIRPHISVTYKWILPFIKGPLQDQLRNSLWSAWPHVFTGSRSHLTPECWSQQEMEWFDTCEWWEHVLYDLLPVSASNTERAEHYRDGLETELIDFLATWGQWQQNSSEVQADTCNRLFSLKDDVRAQPRWSQSGLIVLWWWVAIEMINPSSLIISWLIWAKQKLKHFSNKILSKDDFCFVFYFSF